MHTVHNEESRFLGKGVARGIIDRHKEYAENREKLWVAKLKTMRAHASEARRFRALRGEIDGVSPSMWCEKYRATKYLDLVSDEQINRSVLEWIAQIERLNCAQKIKGSIFSVSAVFSLQALEVFLFLFGVPWLHIWIIRGGKMRQN